MRLAPIAPSALTIEQKTIYENMRTGVAAKYSVFTTTREDGAFVGPWNAWLHDPEIGGAMWELCKAMTKAARLPDNVRQIAILVAGHRFRAGYEIYAHEAVAIARHGMSVDRLLALRNETKPSDLSQEESLGYDVAHALVQGGILPEAIYRDALVTFGQGALNELIYLVAYYCMLSVTLNGYDVPVPSENGTTPTSHALSGTPS